MNGDAGAGAWPFVHSDEVRFGDLDIMGHLNNVAYNVLFESARVAYLRALLPSYDPARLGASGVVVAETKIAYRSPGHYAERVDTRLRPAHVGRTSARLDFEMAVGERVIADGYAVLVLVDRASGRPTPLPNRLRERLLADGAHERSAPANPLTKI